MRKAFILIVVFLSSVVIMSYSYLGNIKDSFTTIDIKAEVNDSIKKVPNTVQKKDTSQAKKMNDTTGFKVIEALDEKGKLVIITANFSYKNYTLKKQYPWYVGVTIKMVNKNKNGHPTAEESIILNRFEDSLNVKLSSVCKCQFVGRASLDGFRDLIYYVDNAEKANSILDKLTKSKTLVRQFKYSIEEDKKWEKVDYIFQSE